MAEGGEHPGRRKAIGAIDTTFRAIERCATEGLWLPCLRQPEDSALHLVPEPKALLVHSRRPAASSTPARSRSCSDGLS